MIVDGSTGSASAVVTISGVDFDAAVGGSVVEVVGFKDFDFEDQAHSCQAFQVVLGPCSSSDSRFRISRNMYPPATSVELRNALLPTKFWSI